MPSPLKERYQVEDAAGNISIRMPCDDMKVADTLVCENFDVYCTDPNDMVVFSVNGGGDLFLIQNTCAEFFNGY